MPLELSVLHRLGIPTHVAIAVLGVTALLLLRIARWLTRTAEWLLGLALLALWASSWLAS